MARIVIIDDDEDILDSMKLVLTSAGYEIRGYANAQAFLKDESTSPPDLYLIDKQMPGMDGLALCQLLRARDETKHIPVVIISATPNIRTVAMGVGASDSIEKPFKIKTLKEVVEKMLRISPSHGGETHIND